MKAVVLRETGGPEVLKIEDIPIPIAKPGQVLIRVKAFGLNRSEMFTRQGHSPDVKLPRVLGIEAAGIVEEAPGGEFRKGEVVATAMGGIGRAFDGGYAEYTCVPAKNVASITGSLPWETLGAMPEMFQTAWGSLFTALDLKRGETLLVRGGTTSIGLAAAGLAHSFGAIVSSTSRRPESRDLLLGNGASQVFNDNGAIAESVKMEYPDGVDKVLELIGTVTMKDSLACTKPRGVVCITGIVGNEWSLKEFSPMEAIPTAVRLTVYGGSEKNFVQTPWNEIVSQVAEGKLRVPIGKVFHIDEIVEAHRCMDENRAGGKIVVLT